MGKIRLLIVDDIADTRANLRRLLQFEEAIAIIGEAGNGEEAVKMARELVPDIILMDVNMPVVDGIQATEQIMLEMPQVGIIILSVQGEQEYLKKAMSAGAREYLIKPPGSDDLIYTIKHIYELEQKRQRVAAMGEEHREAGKTFSVFSTKGGVGRTTFAVNFAAAIAQVSKKKTVIVDLDLQFGDVAMMLDIVPRRSISDLVGEPDLLDFKTIESYLVPHPLSGIKVLPAPLRPEYADAVHGNHVESILKVLKERFDYIIVDLRRSFDDISLTALDSSDTVLVISTLDVLTIKNVKLGLEVMASLHYESSKLKLVLNRSNAEMGVSVGDLEASLKFPVTCCLPSDGKLAVTSSNKGVPFVISDPKSPMAMALLNLAETLTGSGEIRKEKPTGSGWLNIIRRST